MSEVEKKHEKAGTLNRVIGRVTAKKENIFLLALVIILGYSLIYQLTFVEGPSFFGDDNVYTYYAWQALHGKFAENTDSFTLRLLNIYPISFSFLLFGIGKLSSAGWAVFSLLGSIAIAFFLGKELCNEYAGLLAALLLSFFPLTTVLAGTPSPNIPEMFILGLGILSLLYGEKKNSKWWYFISGASFVAAFVATQESSYAFPFVFTYICIELARKKMKIDRTSLFFVGGIALAAVILLIFNYVSSGNPLITISGTAAVYSTAGTPAEGILINNDLGYYFNVIFPYKIYAVLTSSLISGNFNPVSVWNNLYVVNYNYFGFFFYAVVLCAAYLLIVRERRAYVPLLWFALGFFFLEFGPIYVSLDPFKYILTHRLERYLALVAMPLVLTVSIAVVSLAERLKAKNRYAALLPLLLVVFLISTSIPVEQFWYNIVNYQIFDLTAISTYLNALPNTTRISYESGFSSMEEYMHFDNLSRFSVYDQIHNCSKIPAGDYVVIPKYAEAFDLNYTPDPSKYCPGWKLVLYPQINGTYPGYITSAAYSSSAKLYYIPK